MELTEKRTAVSVTLREEMENSPEPYTAGQAVSILMPVALQLSELHEKGGAHEQVSPDRIEVCGDAAKLMPVTGAEVDRYTNGFTPPEIYREKHVGGASDIYSFCAVLLYAATKRIPKNSLIRAETHASIGDFLKDSVFLEQVALDDGFVHIIERGMALSVGDRYASMRELIAALSAWMTPAPDFIIPEAVSQEPPGGPERKSLFARAFHASAAFFRKMAKGRKKFGIKAALICVAAALILLTGAYYIRYEKVRALALRGEFTAAQQHIFLPGILERHDEKLLKYISAGVFFENGNYQEASQAFYGQQYLNSNELALEAKYRYAAQRAEALDWEQAIEAYSFLRDRDYKDSAALLLNARYQEALHQLLVLGEYEKAYNEFCSLSREGESRADERQKEALYYWACALAREGSSVEAYKKFLMIPDYSDAQQALSDLAGTIYADAQQNYHDRQYDSAQELFEVISSYLRSQDYLTLIHVHNAGDYDLEEVDPVVDALMKICDFEDAGDILLSNDNFANKFLIGKWKTNGGSYVFEMKETIDGAGRLSSQVQQFRRSFVPQSFSGTVIE